MRIAYCLKWKFIVSYFSCVRVSLSLSLTTCVCVCIGFLKTFELNKCCDATREISDRGEKKIKEIRRRWDYFAGNGWEFSWRCNLYFILLFPFIFIVQAKLPILIDYELLSLLIQSLLLDKLVRLWVECRVLCSILILSKWLKLKGLWIPWNRTRSRISKAFANSYVELTLLSN